MIEECSRPFSLDIEENGLGLMPQLGILPDN